MVPIQVRDNSVAYHSKVEDAAMDPDAMAQTYLDVFNQHRSSWTQEIDLRSLLLALVTAETIGPLCLNPLNPLEHKMTILSKIKSIENPLLLSGLSEITLAVFLGWVISAMSTQETVGPFKHRKLVLQGHIDYIMMGTIQIALSATEFRKSLDPRLLLAFISGCWVNASLFIVGGVSEKGRGIFGNPHVQRITLLSFLVNTVSWSYMTVKAIKEALGSGSSE